MKKDPRVYLAQILECVRQITIIYGGGPMSTSGGT
jgi:hypothetical protein